MTFASLVFAFFCKKDPYIDRYMIKTICLYSIYLLEKAGVPYGFLNVLHGDVESDLDECFGVAGVSSGRGEVVLTGRLVICGLAKLMHGF